MRGFMRTPYFAVALLLLAGVFFYGIAKMLPAVADETSWEDTKFGPLNGLEESVYSQTMAAYQDSFLSVARKQQPVLGYTDMSCFNIAFRTLPVNPSDYTSDSAIGVVSRNASQDIYPQHTTPDVSGDCFPLRAATAGVRPISADIGLYNGIKQNYTFPSDVYMEVVGDYAGSGRSHYLMYSYMAEDRTQQTKKLKIMNGTIYASLKYFNGRTARGRPLDCVASDLDGDGYSELIVAYLTKSGGSTSDLCVCVEMYDGKELFDAVDGDEVACKSRAEIAKFDLEDEKYKYSPYQVRIAKGDFDGDGIMEFPIAFTSRVSFQLALAKYDKDNNTILEHISNIQFDDLYQHDDTPDQCTTEGMDVTVGDFDGNGADEIMVVYGTYSGKVKENKSENRIAFACFKADIENASFTEYFVAKDDSVNLWCAEKLVAQIYAEAADFDGDGRDELVYAHPGWVDDGAHTGAYISVRQWEWGSLDGIGTLLCNDDTSDISGLGWHFDDVSPINGGSHALAVGNFKCTNNNDIKQIALANYGTDTKIDYAVIEPYVNGEWAYKTYGTTCITDASRPHFADDDDESYTPLISLTAVDYDHQTMLLGEPTVYTLNAKIQPIFELQMAARHYDVVDGVGIDAFAKQVSTPMYGVYKTQADCTENDEVSSTETKASETSIGVSVKASGSGGFAGGKASVNASAGYSYTNTQKQSNTETSKYSATSSVSAAGTYDDFVYYQTKEVDIYRYPIIYPLEYARGSTYQASDDVFGTSGDMEVSPTDTYLEIEVPQKPEMVAVSGLDAEWYDPVHQPYNLFTYPRDMKEIKNYSTAVGETTRTRYNVGSEGSSSVSVKLSDMTGETDTSSTTNKNSVSAELGGGFGTAGQTGKSSVSVSVGFNYDNTESESSTSSSNLTKTSAFTMTWPGLSAYSGVYTGDELSGASFGAALGLLVEKTGNFVMAQMVTDIKNTTSSSLWYQNGTYSKQPDPALNLPHRLNHDTLEFKEATSGDDTPRIMRGVTIYNGWESAGATLSTSNTSYRALMADDDYTVKVRVYNCSFKGANGVKAELYWTNEWADESELTADDKVGETKSPYSLYGWASEGDSNIREFAIEWDASDKLSEAKAAADGMLTGYLHVKVIPNGDEIHSDNNWGYVRMALLDPDVYDGAGASSASVYSAKLASAKSSSATDVQPPVDAKFVKKSAEIITENGKKYIQAKVHLTSKVALPDVKLLVISHQKNGENIIVAGRALGGIHAGEDNVVTVKAPFVEEIARNSTGVSVKVLSPYLRPERPKKTDEGGSGGCSAGGFASLLAFALLPLAGGRRGKK